MSEFNFVSDLIKISNESAIKWTINNTSDVVIPRKMLLRSPIIKMEGIDSKWFISVQKIRPAGLIYRMPDERNVSVNIQFFVLDSGKDRNLNYNFIASVNGKDFHCMTKMSNETGKEMVIEGMDANFAVHMETDSWEISAKCIYDTVKYSCARQEIDLDEIEQESDLDVTKDTRNDEELTSRAENSTENDKRNQEEIVLDKNSEMLSPTSPKKDEEISEELFVPSKTSEKLPVELEAGTTSRSLYLSPRSLSSVSSSSLKSEGEEFSYIYSISDTDDEFEDELVSDFQSENLRITKRIKRIYLEKMRHIAETSARWLVESSRNIKDAALLVECCKSFASQMTTENFVEIWDIAEVLNCNILKRLVLDFYTRNYKEVCSTVKVPLELSEGLKSLKNKT